MKILLIKGASAYDASNIFLDELLRAFEGLGHEVCVVDFKVSDIGQSEIESIDKFLPIDLIYTITILGECRSDSGVSLAQALGAPHVVQLVDFPLSHSARIDNWPEGSAVLVVDRSHVEAVTSCYPAHRFSHVGFCPAGANGEFAEISDDAMAHFASRPIPILFPGSYQAPSTEGWEVLGQARSIIDEAIARMLADETLPTSDALDASMRAFGLEPDHPDYRDFCKLAHLPNEFVRSLRRMQFLDAAAKVGLPLHVYGKGYAEHLSRFPNITYCGEAGLAQILPEIRRAKVVLNVNANFRHGAHDRPFAAGLGGAVIASDESTYLTEQFRPHEAAYFFRWKTLEEDLSGLKTLIDDPTRLHAMARAGQNRVVQSHLWTHRIEKIFEAAAAARRYQNRLAAH